MTAKKKAKNAKRKSMDRKLVAGGQDYEVRYVAKKSGKSTKALKKAIKRVGNSRKRVKKAIKD